MTAASILFASCAAIYLVLPTLVLLQGRRSAIAWALSACCIVTAAWAAANVAWPTAGFGGVVGALDLARAAAWYGLLLVLYQRFVGTGTWLLQPFAAVGAAVVIVAALAGDPGVAPSLLAPASASRLALAICQLLLAENLYRIMQPAGRWHVVLPCVALGALAAFDVLVRADAVLFHAVSAPLLDARAATTAIVAPLLVLAAARDRRWRIPIHVSRQAVFHSTTFVLSGLLLIALAAAGGVVSRFGADWGRVAEIALLFAGVLAIGLLLTSATARSRVHSLIVDHFFTLRYDYRREWMRCVATLSGSDSGEPLHARAIRAVAEVVDSPGGSVFMRDGKDGAFRWQGSWNMPAVTEVVPPTHPALATLGMERGVTLLRERPLEPPLDALGPAWLAVPLIQGSPADVETDLMGFIVLAPPRAAFRLDAEVFALLRTVGREVATYVAEQRAAQRLVQTHQLHDYGKRFAFVAHDIKNVSSQLTLLLANAERHLANPEFQQDMLRTIQASVGKIGNLLRRLESPVAESAQAIEPLPRLEALVATYQRLRGGNVRLEHDGSTGTVPMAAEAFDTVITHLLNNAVEAGGAAPVRILVRHEAERIVVDIADSGRGMT
ncbi:MAG: PEP-CTERM system histidine kinase PrsK, partial [Pseudomonadota bacterium]|nr:PEP-CTERM system histidine kinase PrsK [Pseudomonadota bacterium]